MHDDVLSILHVGDWDVVVNILRTLSLKNYEFEAKLWNRAPTTLQTFMENLEKGKNCTSSKHCMIKYNISRKSLFFLFLISIQAKEPFYTMQGRPDYGVRVTSSLSQMDIFRLNLLYNCSVGFEKSYCFS